MAVLVDSRSGLDLKHARHARHRNVFSPGQRGFQDAGRARSLLDRECGDQVQLICPDYGTAVDQEAVYKVPSIVLPFYKELHLPRPPFGDVHRAIASFRPDIVHIATEATLGWSVLRLAPQRQLAGRLEFPHEFRPIQPPLRSRLGQGPDLAIPSLVSQLHARDLCAVGEHDRRARAAGLRADGTVAARGR